MNLNLEFAEPVQWNQENEYSINDVVFNGTEAYTAIDYVPSGTPLTDTAYWKRTGKYIRTSNLADGSITTTKLVNNVVTNAKIADGAVTTPKLADGAITVDVLPDLITSQGQGESVTAADASYLASLTVDGKAVQDGTPTPSNPVDVQVVKSPNLIDAGDWSGSRSNTYFIEYAVNNHDYLHSVEPVKAGETYTLSMDIQTSVEPFNLSVGLGNGTYATDLMTAYSNRNGRVSATFTPTAEKIAQYGNKIAFRVPRYADQTTFDFSVLNIQLEKGSTATPYTPYGSIGLKVGSTITPIDLQGNILASLPDGTKDVLTVDSVGHVVIDKRVGIVDLSEQTGWEIYDAEQHIFRTFLQPEAKNTSGSSNMMCESYICKPSNTPAANLGNKELKQTAGSQNQYQIYIKNDDCSTVNELKTALTGVLLYYTLTTSGAIDLGYIDMPAIPDGSAISIVAQVTPTISASWWVGMASGVAEAIKSMRDDLVERFDGKITTLASSLAKVESGAASTNYTVGSYLVVENVLYKVTSAIASGESIIPGTNVTATTVMAEIVALTS